METILNFMRKISYAVMLTGMLAIFTGCDSRQSRINTDYLLHSGNLKGYVEVFIQDYERGVSYCDDGENGQINYPVFEKDGYYTIEYKGREYTLQKLDNPIQLLGTDYYYLNYNFMDRGHYIKDIPYSY